MIKMIISDLDDTLMSEYEYVMSGYRAVANYLEQFSSIQADELYNELKKLYDSNNSDPFDAIIRNHDIKKPIKDEIIGIYRYHEPALTLYKDIEDFLYIMKNRGIIMNILTDGDTERQNMKVDALDIRHYFNKVVVAEPEHFKPDKWGYQKILNDISLNPDEILCIGDNPGKDFTYPLNKGFNCIKSNRFVNRPLPPHLHNMKEISLMDDIAQYILE